MERKKLSPNITLLKDDVNFYFVSQRCDKNGVQELGSSVRLGEIQPPPLTCHWASSGRLLNLCQCDPFVCNVQTTIRPTYRIVAKIR